MTYKKNTFRRAAAAAAAICLAFAFAFADKTGADKLGFGASVTVSAADLVYDTGTTAKLYYTVNAYGEITITKVEAGSETRIDVPASIDGKKVTAIENQAFANCATLESITLPESISGISKDLFKGCTSLKIVFLCQNTYTYDGAVPESTAEIQYAYDSSTGGMAIVKGKSNGQTSIDIPETICGRKVTTINAVAFSNNNFKNVTSFTLPQSLTAIGNGAFSGCSSLTSIVIPDSVTEIEATAFSNCTALESITLSQNIKEIRNSTFSNCTALKSIDIPSKTTSIENYVFQDCTALTTVTLHEGLTSIGNATFKNCTALKSINIPNGVTSIESSLFSKCTSLTEITLPGSVTNISYNAFSNCIALKSINISDGVTDIASEAFQNCSSLETITLPESVTYIGNYVFDGCTSLKTAFLPKNIENSSYDALSTEALNIFYEKNNSQGDITVAKVIAKTHTSIEIPDTIIGGKVTVIGSNAFENCDNAQEIKLPETVTEIQSEAFLDCSALRNIDIPQSVHSIGANAFENCSAFETVLIPSGVVSMGANAFTGCTNLKAVYLPDNLRDTSINNYKAARIYYTIDSSDPSENKSTVTRVESDNQPDIVIPEKISGAAVSKIGEEAFSDCIFLNSVNLPDGITSIGDKAFYNCMRLTSINIPDSVVTIGAYAFDSCTALPSIDLPDNGKLSVGERAFAFCQSLETIVIPDSITSIETDLFVNCVKLRSVTLPDSVTSIGDYAFFGCSALSTFNFPADLKTIGEFAFCDCSSLKSVDLPNKLTAIGRNAFAGCEGLTAVTVPDSVKELGAGAFGGCRKLTDVTLPKDLTVINQALFSGTNIKSIVIPESVTEIQVNAFRECINLESIELPPNVTYVGNEAFGECSGLRNVFYDTKTDISYSTIPDTSAKTKYEIRDNLAYILEVVPDSSNTPVVIHDTLLGYEVMSTAEEYRQNVSETGHTHKGGTATCTETAHCAICGTSYNSIDPSNHDADTNTWEYDENGHWNPCSRTGCEEHLNAAAHDFDDGVITTEPTDTADGVKTYTCKVCGYEKTEAVSKRGHNPSDKWTYDSENHWKECTTEGCGEKLDTAAHTFDDGVVTTAPTETAEGIKTYTCTVCGYEKTESIEKLPSKPAAVIYPISISGDVTADKSSAAAGETVTVSAPFGYDIIITDINGRQIAKISEKGSFNMPASRVTVTAVRGETFIHMSNAWNHSYVYSYDSDMNRIKVNSDTRRGTIVIDLGADNAGRSFTLYSGRKSTSKKILSDTLDENGRYIFNADEGKNYTLVIE